MEIPDWVFGREIGYIKNNWNLDGTNIVNHFHIVADGGEDLPLEGQLVSKEKYPMLMEIIREWRGTDGETETEFMLPNFKGREML